VDSTEPRNRSEDDPPATTDTQDAEETMKSATRTATRAPMSADAYAGFLKLLLTPASKPVTLSPDVEAYLAYSSAREPLSPAARRALGQPTNRAA
jgi:hypothetical protein